jgi:2-polyprenyl-3-methyl-5-hydroxy-6-metoxy-1,4-benzoquinol methylase
MFLKFGPLPQQHYKGIAERAAYSLHHDVAHIASSYIKKGETALDIGCGEGAFAQRMIDRDITVDGCDIDVDQIKASLRTTVQLDLNQPGFSSHFTQRYDNVFAIEIIEHIENPWKLIRDAISVLKENGTLIISTPNISNFASRLRLGMTGRLLAFEKNDLKHGHITPLPYFQLEYMFEQCGLSILQRSHGGVMPLFHFTDLSRFNVLRNTVLPLLYPLMGGPKKGRSLVYVLRKRS